MGEYIAPLDFKTIFIDLFLGSGELFIFAFLIGYSLLAARFRFNNRIYLSLLAISGVILGAFIGEALFVLIVMIVGFIVFKGVSRLMT